jgi:hypothetical protein
MFMSSMTCSSVLKWVLVMLMPSLHHHKLFTRLKEIGLPYRIVRITFNWYSNYYSRLYDGMQVFLIHFYWLWHQTRQHILSPCIINVFVNLFITDVREADTRCCVDNSYCGCFTYANDIILLAPSVIGLQLMLDVAYAAKYAYYSVLTSPNVTLFVLDQFCKLKLPLM